MAHRIAVAVTAAASALAALAVHTRPAAACGGCFSPPETVTTVDAHRMAIALGLERTVLWDQIRYSGDPQDFVWVLPVPTEAATIDVADDLFFAELESGTAVRLLPPPRPARPADCPGPGDGVSGFQDAGAAAADAGVDVYREEVVGPYETVVIGSEDAGALVTWLNEHGYVVPDETIPTVQHYADRGDRFIVLRLAPDQGIDAMQPVRVTYPGYMAQFPLKMVTVGAYGKLALTLWVIAEQRYETKNYPTSELRDDQLVWDFATGRSNYRQLFRRAIDESGGRGWVAQFAQPMSYVYIGSEELAYAEQAVEYPYLTRLETDLLVDHLTDDLQLGPAAGSHLDNVISIDNAVNTPPPPSCPDWDGNGVPDDVDERRRTGGCSVASGTGGAALLALLGLGFALRRRRRPTR